jgi:hypothetical protein
VNFDTKVDSGLIIVRFGARSRHRLAIYDDRDTIKRGEGAELAKYEDGMIGSKFLVYEAGTTTTGGYVGRVFTWVEFYAQDRV